MARAKRQSKRVRVCTGDATVVEDFYTVTDWPVESDAFEHWMNPNFALILRTIRITPSAA